MNNSNYKNLNKEIKELQIKHRICYTIEIVLIYQKHNLLSEYSLDDLISDFEMPVNLNRNDISFIKKTVLKELKEKYDIIYKN